MDTLYTLNTAKPSLIQPHIFPLEEEIEELFSVPADNAVATNELDNAITLLKFEGNEIVYDLIAKDFLEYVSGGDLAFLPVFSSDTIGYAQTRGFLLFNIKSKKFIYYFICEELEEYILDVAVVDAEKRHFVFEIECYDDDISKAIPESNKILKIADLSSETGKILATIQIGKKDNWAVQDKTIFVYYQNTLTALNTDFESVEHPLVTFFNKQKETFRRLNQLYIHPSLPFAVLVEIDCKINKDYVVWIVSWESEKQQFFKMLTKNKTFDFEFSPDGKWLIFRDKTQKASKYILMPVNSELPHFLGSPITLGEIPYPETTAWTTNPLSFVVSEGDRILKWDLTNITVQKVS